MRKQIVHISLLTSILFSSSSYCLMRTATKFARTTRRIKKERKKHLNRIKSIKERPQSTDNDKICCTPKTTKALLKFFSGIAALIVTIIKLATKQ